MMAQKLPKRGSGRSTESRGLSKGSMHVLGVLFEWRMHPDVVSGCLCKFERSFPVVCIISAVWR